MTNNYDCRIGLDCRLAGPKNAGIGRYIENLVIRLPQLGPQINWIFTFMDSDQADRICQQIPAKLNNYQMQITPIRHYTLNEQTRLPIKFKQQQLDLLHVPHFNVPVLYNQPLIVTIHDLLWHKQTGLHMTTLKPWQYHLKYLAYRFVTRQAIQKAEQIIVPAQTVKKIVSYYFPDDKHKIIVVYEGFNPAFKQAQLKTNYQNQLIYVGSLYPHKNLQLVFKALTQLPHLKLKIVGSRKIFKNRLVELSRKLQVEKQIGWAGYLEDKKLAQELNQSLALIQPSISEGFGLTGIEAMAAKTAVLASDIPTFKEVYQQAPLYFQPNSVKSLVTAIKQLKQDSVRKEQINQGNLVVRKYNWDQMALATLKLYQNQINH